MATYLISKDLYYPTKATKTETVTADRVEVTHNDSGYPTSARFYNRVPTSPLAYGYGEELVLMVSSPSRIEKVEPAKADHSLAIRLLEAIDRLEKSGAKDAA